ncbi:TIM barrel protein [Streptomyces sp. SID8374]|uniref:sugar phosphate isomerase/epimerase family protein n=1 Tax=Streptomyces sp. SID8374 TaxID=2690354 RepID=UPI00136FB715|nr:sugar phosphate isomerase/epimerase family protein [Streptomyces sp. SID8374]MYX14687.1 TIM barrel protein [Streptomyces sp. SID8374]
MTILDRDELNFSYLHLTGSAWQEPVRHTLEERLSGLAENGCTAMGMSIEELDALVAEHSADKIRGLLDEYGVRFSELEVLFGWNSGPDEIAAALEGEKHFFSRALEFGIPLVKSCAVYPPGTDMPAVGVLAERFGALCDRAAAQGLDVALESIAVLPGFTYKVAADVVRGADRSNGRLLIDMWHLFRDPDGPAAIEELTAAQIAGVEFGDGPLAASEDIMDEVLNRRRLPGDGEFDITGLLHTLVAKGVDLTPSVEILSTELRGLTVAENVARTRAAVRAAVEAARAAL